MKRFIILIVLVFVGVAGWRINEFISRDAISMAIGFLFGALAGIPAALLMMASQRRREESREPLPRRMDDYPRHGAQPPIIVLGGNTQPPNYQHGYQQPYPPQHTQQPPWGATGGGSYNLLPGPQDRRFSDDETKRQWGE